MFSILYRRTLWKGDVGSQCQLVTIRGDVQRSCLQSQERVMEMWHAAVSDALSLLSCHTQVRSLSLLLWKLCLNQPRFVHFELIVDMSRSYKRNTTDCWILEDTSSRSSMYPPASGNLWYCVCCVCCMFLSWSKNTECSVMWPCRHPGCGWDGLLLQFSQAITCL